MRIYFLYFFFLSAVLCKAQNFLDVFRSHGTLGDKAFYRGDYQQALIHYQLRARRNPADAWAKAQTARIYYKTNNKKSALEWYLNVKDTSLLNDNDMMQIGDALHATGKSAEAEKWFRAFRNMNPSDSRTAHKINSIKEKTRIVRDSLSYIVSPIGVNTEHSEFSPYVQGSDFIFLSDRPMFSVIQHSPGGTHGFLEMYKTGILDLNKEPEIYSKKLSSKFHEGPFCFLKKGKQIIFTRQDEKSDKLTLFIAELKNGEWSLIRKLPFNSHEFSNSHPFFSEEDSCLYFVSDRPGSIGGTDIYKSRLQNGAWGLPLNIGPSVNTEGNEMFPYIRNGTLYFSSDGLMGLGGMDIFAYELEGRKMTRNMGYPINSGADDFGIFFKKNDQGYFCSNREGGKGKDDIYEFRNIVQIVSLKVSESFSHAGIPQVKIVLTEGGESETFYTTGKGDWKEGLKPGKTYTITLEASGYKLKDTSISIPTKPTKEINFAVKLERRNKVFIRGMARNEKARPIPNCGIRIINQQNGEMEATISNQEGEFYAEVDPDYTYSIVCENDSLLGWNEVKNLPKKRGAFVTVIDVISKPFSKPSLEIFVKDKLTGEFLDEAELEIKNTTTNETLIVTTDKQGYVKTEIRNRFEYSVRAFCNDRDSDRVVLKNPGSNQTITLFMK